jgi:hypothetical protein
MILSRSPRLYDATRDWPSGVFSFRVARFVLPLFGTLITKLYPCFHAFIEVLLMAWKESSSKRSPFPGIDGPRVTQGSCYDRTSCSITTRIANRYREDGGQNYVRCWTWWGSVITVVGLNDHAFSEGRYSVDQNNSTIWGTCWTVLSWVFWLNEGRCYVWSAASPAWLS